jgi:hypothetical protein
MVLHVWTLYAQPTSNIRSKFIPVDSGSIIIDTLSIVPGTFKINGLDSTYYEIDPLSSRFRWKKIPPLQGYWSEYRVFNFQFTAPMRAMSFDSVFTRTAIAGAPMIQSTPTEIRPDWGKVNSNGSLGRSLAFGNRQDAVLNSSLNLQLSGYLGDSILLNAAISDNNIPIQPDGNTQQLNEFDRVFIQFSKQQWKLLAGDLDIRQSGLRYLNFYKRLQGVSFESENQLSNRVTNKILASGAIAKGKFTRNIFQGIEGNQGPYRLKGANQELFFIVLAGTERVFIDGEMMQRGEDQDYIINYNTAEITFMPKQMITKDKRIQVEFEYADRNYLNSQLFAVNRISVNEKLAISLGIYSNTDAKNSPINQNLTAAQKSFLSTLPGTIPNAYFPSALPDTFSRTSILYKKMDTLYAPNKRDSIFVYTTQPAFGLFNVSFQDVGEGQGDYVLDNTLASNGKVYKWVAPDLSTGKKNGRFNPVVLLVAPRSQQIMNLSAQWKISKRTSFESDVAVSSFDYNTFSAQKNSRENGMAVKVGLLHEQPLHGVKERKLLTGLGYEWTDSSFRPVERLRSVEFSRDWGLELLPARATERIASAQIGLQESGHRLLYGFTQYGRNRDFNASRHQVEQDFNKQGWRLINTLAITQFEDGIKKGSFLRPIIDATKKMSHWNNREFNLRYTLERNLSYQSDTLLPASFSFSTFQIGTRSNPERSNRWGVKYFTRADQLPDSNKMTRADRSHNFNLNGEWMENPHHQFRANVTFRQLDVFNEISPQDAEQSLLGRAEYFTDVWNGGITGNVLYEAGKGQEPRRNFTFIEVPIGQGEYAWIDYNNDGIQQISEFEIANFRDQARFIRIFTPTTDFVRTDYLQFNYQLTVDPSIGWGSLQLTRWKSFLSKFFWQSSYQSYQKNISNGLGVYDPFARAAQDSLLISLDQIFSNTLSFNKYSQIWGIDYNILNSSQRAFLSYGIESRKVIDQSARMRLNFAKKYTLELLLRENNQQLSTPAFSNRNYSIRARSVEPRIAYTKGTEFRVQTGLQWQKKENVGGEVAKLARLQVDAKYNLVANASIGGRFSFNRIEFNGDVSSTLGYVMLEGLNKGKNYLWSFDLTKRLSSFIELTLQYEGRSSGTGPVVHLGRAQIRALL